MSPINYPLVSIVSINFNQLKVTEDFLDSLLKVSYPNFEVIVVDNASQKDPCEYLQKKYPAYKFIRSNENLGFAGGNNLGIRKAKGDYFMMLNNDTVVDPDFLQSLVECMEANPKVGMVGSKVRFFDYPELIQYAGATPMTRFTATSHFIGNKEKDLGQHDTEIVTPFASGAAMMTSRKLCKEVGLMASFFFLYYEELDWQERIRKAGYEIRYIPTSLVFHKESVSVGKGSALQAYWRTRNRFLLIRRNFGNFEVFISFIYMTFFAGPWNAIKYLKEYRWRSLKVHGIAVGWHYLNLFNKKRVHQNEYL